MLSIQQGLPNGDALPLTALHLNLRLRWGFMYACFGEENVRNTVYSVKAVLCMYSHLTTGE